MVCAAPARKGRAGRLKEGALLELLRELFAEGATGVLHLARNRRGLSLRLVNGHVVSGSSGEPSRIGDILVRCGSLSRADLERALVKARSEGRRLGPVLVELGLVDRERLEDALHLQVRDVLFTGLTWHDAEWELAADDAPTPLPEDATLRLSTPRLLLEAEQRIAEPEAVRRALGDLDVPLAAVAGPRREIEQAFEGLARKGHFDVLGIDRSASPDEVKAAYHSLVRRFHPDALGDVASAELEEKARAVFVRVTEAYRVLRATGARSRYEERLGPAPRAPREPSAPRRS